MASRYEMSLYDSVLSSNLPRQEKSQLRKWLEKATELPPVLRPSGKQVHGTLSAFRQSTESAGVGALLGWINAESSSGLDIAGIPIDAALGAAMTIGGGLAASSEMAGDARTIGATSTGIFTFRMTTKLLAEKRLAAGKALPKHLTYTARIAGDSSVGSEGNDPIIRAAEAL